MGGCLKLLIICLLPGKRPSVMLAGGAQGLCRKVLGTCKVGGLQGCNTHGRMSPVGDCQGCGSILTSSLCLQ